ncbi:hypothetical protein QQ045_003393 [Rhodiola kirilowii]
MEMSAGPRLCQKRVVFDETIPSPIGSAAKRSRHSQSATVFASKVVDDLNRISPSLNREAMDSTWNHASVSGYSYSAHQSDEVLCQEASNGRGNTVNNWIDIFVQEMTNSNDLDDAKGRVARILEAFEISTITHSSASEGFDLTSLREHLRISLRDNQILKRAVAFQRERTLDQDENTVEVKRLQHVACQYHEQLQKMEVTNYSLNIHLQRAQEKSSIPGQYPRDVC